jgi:hypothetical protein
VDYRLEAWIRWCHAADWLGDYGINPKLVGETTDEQLALLRSRYFPEPYAATRSAN